MKNNNPLPVRGGAFSTEPHHFTRRLILSPDSRYNTLGFRTLRCCRTPL